MVHTVVQIRLDHPACNAICSTRRMKNKTGRQLVQLAILPEDSAMHDPGRGMQPKCILAPPVRPPARDLTDSWRGGNGSVISTISELFVPRIHHDNEERRVLRQMAYLRTSRNSNWLVASTRRTKAAKAVRSLSSTLPAAAASAVCFCWAASRCQPHH